MEHAQQARSAPRPDEQVVPEIVHDVLAQPGTPLAPNLRADLEPALGADFSQVRVHTDRAAAESAGSVGANAYTYGSHIVFAADRYAPGIPDGRRLLWHELAHVAQQGPASEPPTGPARLGSPTDHAEHEAACVAASLGRPGARAPLGRVVREPVLRRDVAQASVPTLTLDQQYRAALAAADQTGDWRDAAQLLNGFSQPDIEARLAELSQEQLGRLHLGALGNPLVGPDSAVAQLTGAPSRSERSTARGSATTAGGLGAAVVPLLPPGGPGEPPPMFDPATQPFPRMPMEGPAVRGDVKIGEEPFGEGSFEPTSVRVSGGTDVAEGAVEVGGESIADGTELTALTGAVETAPAVAAPAAGVTTGVSVGAMIGIGIIVLAGLVLLLAESDPDVQAPPAQRQAPMTDPGPVTPADAPGAEGEGAVSDPGWHPPLLAPPPPGTVPARLAGQSTPANSALVARLRALRGRNPGLTKDWDGLEQRLQDVDPRVQRAATDELGRLEIDDFQNGPRNEPEPDDIDAQDKVYRDIAQHAWEHVGHREDLTNVGVRNVNEAAELIGEMVARAARTDWWDRLEPGRLTEALFDRETGLVVIFPGPDSIDSGTMFRPDDPPEIYLPRDGFVPRK